MKKSIFFFVFFFILFINFNLSAQNKFEKNFFGCNYNEVNFKSFEDNKNLKIKKIEIEINNYRKWSVNNIKILTSGSRIIADKYKTRFNATVAINYDNDLICRFKAKIRQSGDEKDHISLVENSIIQSLDIELDEGNIKGITKFKLYKENVRGVIEDEILQTQLLRDFGYLSPRTAKVNARINEVETIMLFQEKSAKELLEYNKRREGPILEGDQKYFWKLIESIPQNNLSNWSVGTPYLMNKTMKAMLTKSTNANLIERSQAHVDLTLDAVNKLNLIYLYWANRFQDNGNNYFSFDYDLDNELLGLFNKKNIIKLDIYNLLMQSTNSHHALGPDGRKFYWNSFENYFEPINYDSNPNIDVEAPSTTTIDLRLPISPYYIESIEGFENLFKNINYKKLKHNLNISGIDLSESELLKKVSKILINFEKIKNIYLNQNNKLKIEENYFDKRFTDLNNLNILKNLKNTLNEIDPNALLIKKK